MGQREGTSNQRAEGARLYFQEHLDGQWYVMPLSVHWKQGRVGVEGKRTGSAQLPNARDLEGKRC